MNIVAWQPDAQFWLTLSAVGAFFGKIIIDEFRWKRERREKLDKAELDEKKAKALIEEEAQKHNEEIQQREQDRLDAETIAKTVAILTAEQFKDFEKTILKSGKERMKMLLASNITTRGLLKEAVKTNKESIETSNGIKKDLMENGVKLITENEKTG